MTSIFNFLIDTFCHFQVSSLVFLSLTILIYLFPINLHPCIHHLLLFVFYLILLPFSSSVLYSVVHHIPSPPVYYTATLSSSLPFGVSLLLLFLLSPFRHPFTTLFMFPITTIFCFYSFHLLVFHFILSLFTRLPSSLSFSSLLALYACLHLPVRDLRFVRRVSIECAMPCVGNLTGRESFVFNDVGIYTRFKWWRHNPMMTYSNVNGLWTA